MAAVSLLALIDDIATILDDVAVLSKVAAKKTAGVLGDDLALNAEQVSGVKADRELPVVWAVAKGSMLNKFIIVPSALLISAFLPWLIIVLLVIGGLYLCYEGFEKIAHKWLHSKAELEAEHEALLSALADPNVDLVTLEKQKIKGAIRTDFILSAEIVVIILGSLQGQSLSMQITVVSGLAIVFTVGVYGLVAGIVKLDDAGLYLLRSSISGSFSNMKRILGRGLLTMAPLLMKALSYIGTAAMFLVGGGIIVHNVEAVHHLSVNFLQLLNLPAKGLLPGTVPILIDGVVGVVSGATALLVVKLASKLLPVKS